MQISSADMELKLGEQVKEIRFINKQEFNALPSTIQKRFSLSTLLKRLLVTAFQKNKDLLNNY